MNTQFIFNNILYFPLLAAVVIAIYLIQFCSCISPCNIEFDEDNRREMNIMNRYNRLSENAFSIYLGCVLAGIFVGCLMESSLILLLLMIVQILYIVPVGFVMFTMYGRNKKYWADYEAGRQEKKPLTLNSGNIYN